MYHNYNTTNPAECQDLLASNTIEAFAHHRAYRDTYEPLIIPTLNERQARAWRDCASEVWVRPDGTVSSTISCHCRFCSICAWRDSRRKYSYTMRAMEQLQPLGLHYIFFTVTVRNCIRDDLRPMLDTLMQAVNRMQSTNTWRNRVVGYIRSMETTYNNDKTSPNYNTYHPHIHYILAVPPDYYDNTALYLSAAQWRQLWERSARLDYTAQVKIESIKGEDIKAAVCEVSKYALKLSSVIETGDAEPTKTIADAVRGRRLVAYGGIYKDIQRQIKASDRAERDLNRDISGYVYKLKEDGYELVSPTPIQRERIPRQRVLDDIRTLEEAYRRKSTQDLEALAISLVDSPPVSKSAVERAAHEIKKAAAVSAYNSKRTG